MEPNRHVEAAKAMAHALDIEDYAGAEALLAPECRYEIDGQTTPGPKAIIESYRLIGDWVKATFDSYSYESEVTPGNDHGSGDEGHAVIAYRDLIQHGEHSLDHRCQQVIKADSEGLIIEIRHINLPGEPEKAKAFNLACGVSKPAKS